MEPDTLTSLYTVVIAVVTALSSTKAWDFWQKRQIAKRDQDNKDQKETHLYRDDLREEVKRLRNEIIDLYEKREVELKELQGQIASLKEQLAAFKTRVEFLEKENKKLKSDIDKDTE